jgi:hypothetical protein
MLQHTFVTTRLDAGVDLRDVQIAARHADPGAATRRSYPTALGDTPAGDRRPLRAAYRGGAPNAPALPNIRTCRGAVDSRWQMRGVACSAG